VGLGGLIETASDGTRVTCAEAALVLSYPLVAVMVTVCGEVMTLGA
jgi:hypothetical protein